MSGWKGKHDDGSQSALVLIRLGSEGAEEERGALVHGVGCGRDGRHAVPGINDDKRLEEKGCSACEEWG